MTGMPKTTLNCGKAAADICRERGWVAGTRIVGNEGYGDEVLLITAVGERCVLAKTLARNGEPVNWGREASWSLGCRDWKAA